MKTNDLLIGLLIGIAIGVALGIFVVKFMPDNRVVMLERDENGRIVAIYAVPMGAK
jgi:ABC-type phosphate transport system permease subunit